MKIRYAGICFKGDTRKNNEDNVYINGVYLARIHEDSPMYHGEGSNGLFAVFDGIGGESSGETASYLAASNIGKSDIFQINRLICQYIEKKGVKSCGTTAAVLFISDHQIRTSNLGDSRIYRFHQNRLIQVSEDHVRYWGRKRYLTQSLGVSTFLLEPHELSLNPIKGDKYLLCSDGLTDMVSDNEIGRMCSKSAKEAVSDLRELVIHRGSADNTSIIVIEILE